MKDKMGYTKDSSNEAMQDVIMHILPTAQADIHSIEHSCKLQTA